AALVGARIESLCANTIVQMHHRAIETLGRGCLARAWRPSDDDPHAHASTSLIVSTARRVSASVPQEIRMQSGSPKLEQSRTMTPCRFAASATAVASPTSTRTKLPALG